MATTRKNSWQTTEPLSTAEAGARELISDSYELIGASGGAAESARYTAENTAGALDWAVAASENADALRNKMNVSVRVEDPDLYRRIKEMKADVDTNGVMFGYGKSPPVTRDNTAGGPPPKK